MLTDRDCCEDICYKSSQWWRLSSRAQFNFQDSFFSSLSWVSTYILSWKTLSGVGPKAQPALVMALPLIVKGNTAIIWIFQTMTDAWERERERDPQSNANAGSAIWIYTLSFLGAHIPLQEHKIRNQNDSSETGSR